jgi:alkylated DNA repair dioxygenase AlkB
MFALDDRQTQPERRWPGYASNTGVTMVDGPLDDAVISWQGSLFGFDDPSFDPAFAGVERIWLDEASWVDHLPAWLSGADLVFADLVARLPWRQRKVTMYGRLVDEPRLSWWWAEAGDDPVHPELLEQIRVTLSMRYDERFDSIGCNLYRNGADSVAWHADSVGRHIVEPLVAIVSVGAPRPFQMRPLGGGPSLSFLLGQGDLLVMGGGCQRFWQHCVPKVAAAGPRLSITYRHGANPASERDLKVGFDRAMTRRHPSFWLRA